MACDDPAVQAAWRAAYAHYSPLDLGAHPDWCAGIEATYPGSVHLVVTRVGGDAPDAVVPVVLKPVELDCQLGELRLARFRPRVLQLAGALPGLPEDGFAYAAFFQTLLSRQSRWHALRFTVPAGSFLEAFLASPGLRRLPVRRYQPASASPHHLIRLPPTFADYAAQFTSKTRGNRQREVRNLQQRGRLELACFRGPSQVDAFLREAGTLSLHSYQHRLLGVGLREPEHLRTRLLIAARHGWLRAYILRCGGESCSYLLGYQYQGCYHYTKVGYDQAWADRCPGTVLQWLVLQHLYAEDTPATFDFGAEGPQKAYFGNHQFQETEVYFFRPGIYPGLVRGAYHGSRRANAHLGVWMSRHQFKPRARRWLRRLRGC